MNVLRANPEKDAVIWQGRAYGYAWLYEAVSRWDAVLEERGVRPGGVVSLEADFSPNAIGLLLALIQRSCIVVPLTASVEVKKSEFREIAQVETVIGLADGETSQVRDTGARVGHVNSQVAGQGRLGKVGDVGPSVGGLLHLPQDAGQPHRRRDTDFQVQVGALVLHHVAEELVDFGLIGHGIEGSVNGGRHERLCFLHRSISTLR